MANILGFAQNLRMDEKIGGMLDDYQRQRNIEREMLNRESASKLQAETMGLQNEQARMSLAALRRQQDVDRMAREAYAGARPTSVANPAYVSPEQFSLAATAGPPAQYAELADEAGQLPKMMLEYPGQGVSPQDIASLQNLKPETLTKPADPYGAMADVYAREGDTAGLKDTLTIQDMLAKTKAKGDPVEFEKSKNLLDNYSNFYKQVADLRKEGTPSALAQAQKISEVYQYMNKDNADMFDISDWEVREDGIYNPQYLTDGTLAGYFVHADGVTKFVQAKPEAPQYKDRTRPEGTGTVFEESTDGGKTWKVVSRGAKGGGHGGSDSTEKDYRKQSYQLQKEIRGDKYINQADDSNQKLSAMENAYAEGKKTGNYVGADQAIGYYVNKLFDPDSVVMVSEFQRVAQSQGVPSKILGSLQSVATGGIKLTDESRDALIRTVKEINNTVQARKSDRLRQYRMDAISLGLNPDNVLAGRDAGGKDDKPAGGKPAAATIAPKGPKPGDIEDGYRFKGGDRANPKNWVKVGK